MPLSLLTWFFNIKLFENKVVTPERLTLVIQLHFIQMVRPEHVTDEPGLSVCLWRREVSLLLCLIPIPHNSPLGHLKHSSFVKNPEQNQSGFFFLFWVSELNQLIHIRISRNEPHESELAGMSPFFMWYAKTLTKAIFFPVISSFASKQLSFSGCFTAWQYKHCLAQGKNGDKCS